MSMLRPKYTRDEILARLKSIETGLTRGDAKEDIVNDLHHLAYCLQRFGIEQAAVTEFEIEEGAVTFSSPAQKANTP
jgi:hypothetical protein